ncbi:MAG: hypothetical protein ABI439_07625 [Rhodospirillales bacterium]
MTLNRQQLAKILELLSSEHDGEALAAARRADAMVKASGEDWAALLGVEVPTGSPLDAPVRPEPVSQPQRRRGREITSYEMLMALLQSDRTPAEVKKGLRPLEKKLFEGDIGGGEIADLRMMFSRYVARASTS